MRKVKGVFRNEKWANKILFTVVVAVLVILVGSWPSLATLLENPNPFANSGYYGYGYLQEGQKGYGYHTYTYQPLKDTYGLHSNGSLIKRATSGDIYWINEGMKRHIRSPVAFESWGFDWASVITVSDAEFNAYETAADLLMRPGTLVKQFHDPNVYLFGFDDKLHWITSPDIFNNLGLRWQDIREISFVEFNTYTIGFGLGTAMIPADGSLVKGSGPNIYLFEWIPIGPNVYTIMLGWIRSPVAFESYGFEWESVSTIPDAELSSYLILFRGIMNFRSQNGIYLSGLDIMAKPGTLIRGSTPQVYVVDFLAYQETTPQPAPLPSATYRWKKRWITSPDVFNAKGFRWENIKTESDSEIAVYATGTNVQ